MSKELYLPPHGFHHHAARKDKPHPAHAQPRMALARIGILGPDGPAGQSSQLPLIGKKVLFALSSHFKNFYTSGLAKAAGSPVHGLVKDDVLYLPMICVDPKASPPVSVRRIALLLAHPHGKVNLTPARFRSIKNPDAHVWVCFTRAMLGSIVKTEVGALESASGGPMDVVSAALVLKNKAKGRETGEELTLYVALAR
ncbi:MAG: hypothetical protein WC263_02140 [Candidatus Micrarchaeia archaeon]|jgi:hypothetical protein